MARYLSSIECIHQIYILQDKELLLLNKWFKNPNQMGKPSNNLEKSLQELVSIRDDGKLKISLELMDEDNSEDTEPIDDSLLKKF